MNTANVFQSELGASRSMPIQRSQSSKCPVELTGRNSVTPSTMPRMIALSRSGMSGKGQKSGVRDQREATPLAARSQSARASRRSTRPVRAPDALYVQQPAPDGDGDRRPDADVAE